MLKWALPLLLAFSFSTQGQTDKDKAKAAASKSKSAADSKGGAKGSSTTKAGPGPTPADSGAKAASPCCATPPTPPERAMEVHALPSDRQSDVSDVIKALKNDTEFEFAPVGNDRILVLCKLDNCTDDIATIDTVIDDLARAAAAPAPSPAPSPAPVPLVFELPNFCISERLWGPRPDFALPPGADEGCPLDLTNPVPRRMVQANNAKDIATALSKDPDFTVTPAGNSRIVAVCTAKTPPCSSAAEDRIKNAVHDLAFPTPAFIQDVEVPPTAIFPLSKALPILGITADIIGAGKLRLKADAPVLEVDVATLIQQYSFGLPPPTTFRVFYQGVAGNGFPGQVAEANALLTQLPPSAPPSSGGTGGGGTQTPANQPQNPSSSTSSTSSTPPSTIVANANVVPPAASPCCATPAGGTAPPATATNTITLPSPPASSTPTPTVTPAPSAPANLDVNMVAVNDNIVFKDAGSAPDSAFQRARLLALLDLPRPEVLMNVWSYQASSPNGEEILDSANRVRNLVASHNSALENSIQYGWAYLSREMRKDWLNSPGARPDGQRFFNLDFYNYITQKFVAPDPNCPGVTCGPSDPIRKRWGFCPREKYCLGYAGAFQPLKPNLTNILLGAIAAEHPLKTILTTIGCMEGKWEVYAEECFPDRDDFKQALQSAYVGPSPRYTANRVAVSDAVRSSYTTRAEAGSKLQIKKCIERDKNCLKEGEAPRPQRGQRMQYQIEVENVGSVDTAAPVTVTETVPAELTLKSMKGDGWDCKLPACTIAQIKRGETKTITVTVDAIPLAATCLHDARANMIKEERYSNEKMSCELLDQVALRAQEKCQMAQTFPMSCFTIQAAQSFSSHTAYSTFSFKELNELAEAPLANSRVVEEGEESDKAEYGTSRIGQLRASIADFLFNYKMSQEFPQEFTPYDLQHSAQELNAELNPMVVAFNQDVAEFSHYLSNELERSDPKNHAFKLWRDNKSFLSDGIITLRGVGGYPSSVQTQTQNSFDATQAQSLSAILNNLTGQPSGGGGTPSPAAALEKGALNSTTGLGALSAILPPPTQAKIGRQLNFMVIPHTLPGASSAELDVSLQAGEDAAPALYQLGKVVGTPDNLSRVAYHNVTTRVRVESIKLFELSSFSALIQRPRSKFPLVPPFIELPFIGSFASVPLPGAREYHRSTAIVSAVIVPTAADLGFGLEFVRDRLITKETPMLRGLEYEMRGVSSLSQFQTQSQRMPIRAFHRAMLNCLATNGRLISTEIINGSPPASCSDFTFNSVPPEF